MSFRFALFLGGILVMALAGCQTPTPKDYTAFRQSRPKSILVLPPINATTEVGATYSMYTTMTRPIAELGYYVFPVVVVDQFMKENGLTMPADMQQAMLRAQLEIAQERDLPVIFHVRNAFDDFWPLFDSFNGVRGVLHSFTDNRVHLQKALERGLYIGVNGISTFTKDQEQRNMFASIPVERLLLETDAPYLTPVPLRGTVNEPAFITHVAQFHADLHTITLEELSVATSANATTLFNLN